MKVTQINVSGSNGDFQIYRMNDRAVGITHMASGDFSSTTVAEEVCNIIDGPDTTERDIKLIYTIMKALK